MKKPWLLGVARTKAQWRDLLAHELAAMAPGVDAVALSAYLIQRADEEGLFDES